MNLESLIILSLITAIMTTGFCGALFKILRLDKMSGQLDRIGQGIQDLRTEVISFRDDDMRLGSPDFQGSLAGIRSDFKKFEGDLDKQIDELYRLLT